MSDLFRDARHGYVRMAKAIAEPTAERGYPPSMKEIAARCGVSVDTVYKWIDRMERDGYLTRTRRRNRTIVLTPSGYTLAGVPPREPAPAGVVADRKTAGVRAAKERAPMT